MKKEYIIYKLSESIKSTSRIDNELFTKYNVKRGLRNEDHSGVLVGLTQIGDVVGYERLPEGLKAIPGRLLYRGIDVNDLVKGIHGENRFGFEEAAFLLLSGYLPNREELESFQSLIHAFMPLGQKTKMNILDLEGSNVMNILARCVMKMFDHLKENIRHWDKVTEIDQYLNKMLRKEAYDHTGLIYGIGHAVYTISDPRALLLKEMARDLAKEKEREEEYAFLELLEERAIENFMNFKGTKVNKRVCANVDFYSGFVYDMIGLPQEVFTPLFAMSRITGWTAHRIEELNFDSKRIIRPAYKNVAAERKFVPLKQR